MVDHHIAHTIILSLTHTHTHTQVACGRNYMAAIDSKSPSRSFRIRSVHGRIRLSAVSTNPWMKMNGKRQRRVCESGEYSPLLFFSVFVLFSVVGFSQATLATGQEQRLKAASLGHSPLFLLLLRLSLTGSPNHPFVGSLAAVDLLAAAVRSNTYICVTAPDLISDAFPRFFLHFVFRLRTTSLSPLISPFHQVFHLSSSGKQSP